MSELQTTHVYGDITLDGTVDTIDVKQFRRDFDTHHHDPRYINTTGDTMTGAFTVDRNGNGVRLSTSSSGEPYIAPLRNNDFNYGKELRYDGEWNIEGKPRAGGSRIATRPWSYRQFVDESGDTMHGTLDMNDNQIKNDETLDLNADGNQSIQIHTNSGSYKVRDADSGNQDVLQYTGGLWYARGGRWRFEGGSVYLSNSNENNDSYDLVFENKPSNRDFRLHLKRDPENSNLDGNHGMLFSTDGDSPHLTVDVDKGITHVQEIRSVRDERSGTPLATAYLGNDSNVGEIWYDPGPGEFRGKRRGGEIVRLGTPI